MSAVPLQRFTLAGLPATPWKNGGGSTREVACWPPGAGLDDFDWRISIATIAVGGPFSTFAGIDRTIMLLDGPGVRLRSQDGAIDHRLDRPLQPFPFSGDVALDCELLGGGASTDFNVMARRGRWQAQLMLLREPAAIASAPHGLLLAVAGRWQLDDQTLAEGEGLWWAGMERDWQATPASNDACLVAVRFGAAAEF